MRHDFQYRRLRVFTIDSRRRRNDGGLIEGLDSGDVMIRILFGFNAVKKDDRLFVQRLFWLEE